MKMNIRLNLVLIGDENYGGFTAYFEEFPNVIAEGDNEEEAEFKLINLLKVALEYRTTKIVRADGQKQKGIRKELNAPGAQQLFSDDNLYSQFKQAK